MRCFPRPAPRPLTQLQQEAAAANVALPPKSLLGLFHSPAHVGRLTFAPGSLEPLSVQLGEVKTISEIFLGRGINALDGIQRVRVSPDDAGGPQTDNLAEQPLTNNLAVLVPYQITFRAFSPEIARVLEAFAASPHGFIVKTIGVQPAGVRPAVRQPDIPMRAAFDPNGPQSRGYPPATTPRPRADCRRC